MRTIIVHLAGPCTEDEVAGVLDCVYERNGDLGWVENVEGDPCLYIQFYRDHSIEYSSEQIELLKKHFSGEMPLSVAADVSGRHDGTPQVRQFVSTLLMRFPGLASDDFTDRFWSRHEIEQNAMFDGLSFFDYRESYNRGD